MKKQLDIEAIDKISSVYLNEGRKQESWAIRSVEIDEDMLRAKIHMTSVYISPTDSGGFHLSSMSALEFICQLTIIYGHVWGDKTEKKGEGWMLDSSIKCNSSIRNPDAIEVTMCVEKIKKIKGKTYLVVSSSIIDDQGGHFKVKMKALA